MTVLQWNSNCINHGILSEIIVAMVFSIEYAWLLGKSNRFLHSKKHCSLNSLIDLNVTTFSVVDWYADNFQFSF